LANRNPLFLLVSLAGAVLLLSLLSVGSAWWSYRSETQLLPQLFGQRLEKINLTFAIIENAKQMAEAERCLDGQLRTDCYELWRRAATQVDTNLGALWQLVQTRQGQDLLLVMWQNLEAGSVDPSWNPEHIAHLLLANATAFASLQQQRISADAETAGADIAAVLRRITAAVVVIGGLILAVVVFCLVIVGRNLLTTHLVLTTTANSLLIANGRKRVVAVNPAFEKMAGIRAADIVGRPLESVGYTGRWLAEVLRTGEPHQDLKVRWPRGDGSVHYLSLDLFPWHDKRGRLRGGMAVVRDITAQWQKSQEMGSRVSQSKELAARDQLTDLFSHRTFMEKLTALIDRSRSMRQPLALLMIDLDHFKVYNDALGSTMGDQLLRECAQLLAACVRKNDLIGRYGGDEFVVALAGADNTIAAETAERIRDSVAYHPFPGREVLPGGRLTASVGVSFFPGSARTCLDLVRRADAALYEAKRTSRNRVELYFSALDELRKTLRNDNGTLITTVKSLLSVIHSQDRYTFHHSDLVVRYSTWIGKSLGWDSESLQQLRVAALVHDIGKIHVSPRILTKTHPLSKLEWGRFINTPFMVLIFSGRYHPWQPTLSQPSCTTMNVGTAQAIPPDSRARKYLSWRE
jgi:diguanylate cyclase (GGDEF)-like protein/PAS domain S-box-containing protein